MIGFSSNRHRERIHTLRYFLHKLGEADMGFSLIPQIKMLVVDDCVLFLLSPEKVSFRIFILVISFSLRFKNALTVDEGQWTVCCSDASPDIAKRV